MGNLSYIHYLRGIAAFFIVVIHFNLFLTEGEITARIFKYFLLEWTAIFVMISGFLFQHLLHKYTFKRFMLSKLKNVIIPYVIISIPAILVYTMGIKKDHTWVDIQDLMSHSIAYVVLFFYATGSHLGPLWFIPVLILIFLTSKPLSMIGNNQKLLNIASLVSLVAIVFTSRPENDSNAFIAYLHFLPVYIIGMFICSKKDGLISGQYKYLFLILFLFSFVVCVVYQLSASLAILSKIPLFIFLCSYLDSFKNRTMKNVFSMLADASFAIYFIHGYFVGVLRKILPRLSYDFSNAQAILLTTFISALTVVFVVAILYILKRFPLNTRMIIGS